ncbi:MAG: transcriptional repressor [Clostridiales bacterium]|nr:transcriptional repressor [Clostridiales bacterium]
MAHLQGDLAKVLIEREIKPSYHRIRIYRYLVENRTHPTVEQIYSDLQKELPTLSKATIYNTLKLFSDKGIAKTMTIEEKEARYDIVEENHGHFKCKECGDIYDFKIDIDDLGTGDLNGFKIDQKDVYFKGICRGCQ